MNFPPESPETRIYGAEDPIPLVSVWPGFEWILPEVAPEAIRIIRCRRIRVAGRDSPLAIANETDDGWDIYLSREVERNRELNTVLDILEFSGNELAFVEQEILRSSPAPAADLPPASPTPDGPAPLAHPAPGDRATAPPVVAERPGRTARGDAGFGWIPKDGNVRFGGRNLGGMIYFGHAPRDARDGAPEKAWIDPRKSLTALPADIYFLDFHNYWPNYSTLDGWSRAAYLDWLASSRSDPHTDARYVLLYFYGLERRVFVDHAEPNERAEIIAEVRRLLDIYGEDPFLRHAFVSFLDAASLLDAGPAEPIFDLDGVRSQVPAPVLVALGRMAVRGEPLTSDWLLSWWVCHPSTTLRAPARRAFPEFRACFRHRFEEQYPEGLPIRVPKRPLGIEYRPASGNFAVDLTEHLGGAGNVSGFSAPLRVAEQIAGSAARALHRYSRYLARNPDGRGAIRAHTLLPDFLRTQFPCPAKEEFLAWAKEHAVSGRLVHPKEIIRRLGEAPPRRIATDELLDAADLLGQLGVGIAPDPRFALVASRASTPVVLFPLPEDARKKNPSAAYRRAILGLAVGIRAARAGGRLRTGGRAHLTREIEANPALTEAERARLAADLVWMDEFPPDWRSLEQKLGDAPAAARRRLAQAAIAAAVADGAVPPAKLRAVERLYAAVGRARDRVRADLQRLASTPGPPSPPSGARRTQVALDAARVSEAEADTARVGRLLGNIFDADADRSEIEESSRDPAPAVGDRWNGLDAAHRAVASVLITRPEWTEAEVADLARKHRLLRAGALETINEWSVGEFGEALLEEHGGVEVNREVAERLRS